MATENQLNHKIYGEGYPVIILHGLFGMLDNWQSFAKKLAKEYQVISIDQRNHGRSFHSDEFSYEHMAADLSSFLEERWIHECYIIGHSMGGKTAMRYTLDNPDKVGKLVVVDIAPEKTPDRHSDILDALESLDLSKINSRKQADVELEKKIGNAGTRLFLLKNLKRKGNDFSWRMNLSVLIEKYNEVGREIEGDVVDTPALFIDGALSNYIHPDNEKKGKNHQKCRSLGTCR